jgi:membrane protein
VAFIPRTTRVARLALKSASSWSGDHAQAMGAALSYYAMFSIAPLLVIIIAVAGMIFGEDAVRGALFGQLADLMGEAGAAAVREMLAHASQPKTGTLATAISIVVLLVGASGVFGQLQAALDRIWRCHAPAKESGVWRWLRSNLLSMGMAFLITVSLILSAALAALGEWWTPVLGGWELAAHLLDLSLNLVLLTAVFAMIYKIMPRASIEWRDVWIGAAVTALLFTIGKVVIGLYLGKSHIGSSFGAFGSLVILMVWVYYSAQIFLYGAEFTWVYAHELGSRRGEPQPPPIEDLVRDSSTAERSARLDRPQVAAHGQVRAEPAQQAGGHERRRRIRRREERQAEA